MYHILEFRYRANIFLYLPIAKGKHGESNQLRKREKVTPALTMRSTPI